MIYLTLTIIILTIITYLISKKIIKVLKITSIATSVSGILTLIIGYIIKHLINKQINFINISKITNLILLKFLKNSIYLLLLGLIEFIVYLLLSINHQNKKEISTT